MKNPELKSYSLPDYWDVLLDRGLESLGLHRDQPEKLAASVHKLSNYYLSHPGQTTPYKEDWARVASLVYYLPLNYLRARAVVGYGQDVGFFADLNKIIDFGSGLAPMSLALRDGQVKFQQQTLVEKSESAQRLQEQWIQNILRSSTNLDFSADQDLSNANLDTFPTVEANTESDSPKGLKTIRSQALNPLLFQGQDLLTFSYSWTELEHLPPEFLQAEALVIIEPSTFRNSRRLQKLRSHLLQVGYWIWAPCTHHQDCPLLSENNRDWCHHRIQVKMPPWFLAMEKYLPMQNRTLTFSYLLARKSPPPKDLQDAIRVIGDWQKEKGKSRQLVCRGPQREFLSLLKKNKIPIRHQRGDLIQLPMNSTVAGNEIRPTAINPWYLASPELTELQQQGE